QSGIYNEVVVLLNGINVWGGYSLGWQRGPSSNPANRVTIHGGLDNTSGGDGEYMAIRAHDLGVPVTVGDVILQAPDAMGVLGGAGKSSYGVHVKSANVRFERIQIIGGNGAAGAAGSNGQDAVLVSSQSYMDGSVGGAGASYDSICDTSSRGGGGA